MTKAATTHMATAKAAAYVFSLLCGLFLSLSCATLYAQSAPASAAQLIATGQYTQALHQLARIPPAQRSLKQTLQLASCHQHLQHYDEAIHILDTLDATAQQRLEVVLLYVDIEYAQTRWQSAAQRLQAVADRYAAYPGYVLRYAQVHQALGNREAAEAAYSYYGVLRRAATQGVQQ